MKALFILFIASTFTLFGQEDITHSFDSKILSESRQINIHLPKSYNSSDKSYPVIYALDGDYTKYALNGVVDLYSYWDKIPECIVVSIDQNYMDTASNYYKRWLDCSYSQKTGFPGERGEKFKEFISGELLPYIDSEYRTTNYKAIIGHSFTANYINYFLLDEKPVFQGYVAISPYYVTNSLDSISKVIQNLKTPIMYYVATGDNDLSGHIKSVNDFDKQFSKIENEFFIYKKFGMKNNHASHATILPIAIPDAIEHLFSAYSSIDEAEFKKILKIEDKIGYLKNRYLTMEELYGIKKPISENDISYAAYAMEKKRQWSQIKEIGKMTIELYPESYTGYFILGEYKEKMKRYDLALIQYELGFSKLGDDVTNKADFQEEIDRVKKKIK